MKTILKRCKGGIMAAAAACFIALVYGPLELYFTNREDFWFAPDVIVPEVIFLFAAALLGSILLLALANRFAPKLYTLLTGCFMWGAMVCYIHSNFLSGWLPSMDGAAVDWNAYPVQRALSAAACVLVAAFAGFLAYKKWLQKAAFWGGSVLTLMLLVTVITLGIGSTSTAGSYYFSTNEGLQDYSSDKNFVIFVLDAVDGDTFESVIDENKEYSEALQDFTYYSDSLSAYPYTYYAITQLLTGQWYEGSVDFESFRAQALCSSPLFSTLQQQGYRMGVYVTEPTFDKNSQPERFENLRWEAPKITSHPALWRVILRMSCVKNAPFDLKRLGYSLPEKLNGLKQGDSDKANRDAAFSVSDRDFLERCQQGEVQLGEDKVFKYIHIEGAHSPFQYGPQMQDVSGTDQATYRNQVAGAAYTMAAYLDMLRESGCYDDTAILILSDHGYTEQHIDGTPQGELEHELLRRHGIVLAKGFGEHHELQKNAAPLSYDDLQDMYARLLNGESGQSLIDWQEGESRERRFLSYEMENAQNGFTEMVQNGRSDTLDSIRPTGNVYYPPKSMLG